MSFRHQEANHEIDFYATIHAMLPLATQHALEALLEPDPAPTMEERTADRMEGQWRGSRDL